MLYFTEQNILLFPSVVFWVVEMRQFFGFCVFGFCVVGFLFGDGFFRSKSSFLWTWRSHDIGVRKINYKLSDPRLCLIRLDRHFNFAFIYFYKKHTNHISFLIRTRTYKTSSWTRYLPLMVVGLILIIIEPRATHYMA